MILVLPSKLHTAPDMVSLYSAPKGLSLVETPTGALQPPPVGENEYFNIYFLPAIAGTPGSKVGVAVTPGFKQLCIGIDVNTE